ncbi:hypothetical protein [Mycobacteroides chelonae]|uniref:Uncharacterized protein n=1 Tax=Mycobacteroides chelonae TaxID=1774 RepID=A0A1S1M2D3_MYCCH|nr:hypothetical protein [Mycobacteroides chelonae]OHU76065.1 hypothetical protein BKG84_24535 [Mycobacteroides chelonae]
MTEMQLSDNETELDTATQRAVNRHPLGVAAHALRAGGIALMVAGLVVFGVGGLLYVLAAPIPFVVLVLAYGVMMGGAVLIQQARKLGLEAIRGEMPTAVGLLSVPDSRRYLLAYEWYAQPVDRDGFVAGLQRITASRRFLNQPSGELPSVWVSTDGGGFVKLSLACDSRCDATGTTDDWLLTDTITHEVVEQLSTMEPRHSAPAQRL